MQNKLTLDDKYSSYKSNNEINNLLKKTLTMPFINEKTNIY